MRTLLLLLSIIALGHQASAQVITLPQAILDKAISAQISSTGEHSGRCIIIDITNNSPKQITIQISSGTYLLHQDSVYQNHVITQDTLIALAPHKSASALLQAYCTEPSDACPPKGSLFAIGKNTNPNLAALCQLIAKYNPKPQPMSNYPEQAAVWALMQNTDANNINGEDSLKIMTYRKFVANTLHQKVVPFQRSQYTRPATIVEHTMGVTVKGNYHHMNAKTTDKIIVAIYNQSGQAVSQTLSQNCNDLEKFGNTFTYNMRYNVSAQNLDPSQKYYFRLLVNNVIVKENLYRSLL